MLIIFEGNEGSGKSTLSKELANLYMTEVMKRSSHIGWHKTKDNWSYAWDLNQSCLWDWRFLIEMLKPQILQRKPFIADRSFITQEVYHRAFWPESLISPMHEIAYDDYAKELASIPHLIVYVKRASVRTDDETVLKAYSGNSESFKKIDKQFSDYFTKHALSLNILHLENNGSIKESIEQIVNRLQNV